MQKAGRIAVTIATLGLCACRNNPSAGTHAAEPSPKQTSGSDAGTSRARQVAVANTSLPPMTVLPGEHEIRLKSKNGELYRLQVAAFRSNYQVTAYKFPKRTSWEAGDKAGEIENEVYDIIKLMDLRGRLGTLPVENLADAEFDPKLTMKVVFPSGESAQFPLPPARLGMELREVLSHVENGGVLFDKETADDTTPHASILWPNGVGSKLFGRAAVLQDVDGVLVSHTLPDPKGTKLCTGYRDNSGHTLPQLTLQLVETEAVVFERRTGNVWARRVFPPDTHCPMFVFQRRGETTQTSAEPYAAIESWARTLVRR